MKKWNCSNRYYSPHIILTPPIKVYLPTNLRKNLVPTTFGNFLGRNDATSISWALSISVLFILLMHLNKWHTIFKYYTFIFFIGSSGISIISCSSNCYCSFTLLRSSLCDSAESHKLDLSIVVLNLMPVSVVYPPLDSSFISKKFLF